MLLAASADTDEGPLGNTIATSLTVSRIAGQFLEREPIQAALHGRSPKRGHNRRKPPRDVTVPIEATLRLRRSLGPSASDPSFDMRARRLSRSKLQAFAPPFTAPIKERRAEGLCEEDLCVPGLGPSKSAARTQPRVLTPAAAIPRTGPLVMQRVPATRPDISGPEWPQGNNWHSVLSGRQKIELPGAIPVDSTDAFVSWYRQREMERQAKGHAAQPSRASQRKTSGKNLLQAWAGDEDLFAQSPFEQGIMTPGHAKKQPSSRAATALAFTPAMARQGWTSGTARNLTSAPAW